MVKVWIFRIFRRPVFLGGWIAVFLPTVCLAQSGKIRTISAPSTVGSSGVNSSLSSFRAYSASASSYGNLYRAPAGGGALRSSIQTLPSRGQRSRSAAGSMNPRATPTMSRTTKSLSAGAAKSFSLRKPTAVTPRQTGAALSVPGAAGPTPGMAIRETEAPLASPGKDTETDLWVLAEHSGRAYLAVSPSASVSDSETEEITSLVPEESGVSERYREMMQNGEDAFTKEDYTTAARCFSLAGDLSLHSTESLLSQARSHFATAQGGYNMTAHYLRRALQQMPELPLVPVCPKTFYGDPSRYVQDLIRLETYAQEHPSDANAHFVLGYLKWRDNEFDAARDALRRALAGAQGNEEFVDDIGALWDGMAASGNISGELKPDSPSRESRPFSETEDHAPPQ